MKVRIRPLEEKDAYTSLKWRNIPEIWAYTGSKPDHEITLEDELAWIRRVMADPSSRRFAILADEIYVGNVYLTNIHDEVGEYHIFIGDQNYWGKGIAKEASKEIIEFGAAMGLKELILYVKKDNQAAFGMYLKLGFVETGTNDGETAMSLKLNNNKEAPA